MTLLDDDVSFSLQANDEACIASKYWIRSTLYNYVNIQWSHPQLHGSIVSLQQQLGLAVLPGYGTECTLTEAGDTTPHSQAFRYILTRSPDHVHDDGPA